MANKRIFNLDSGGDLTYSFTVDKSGETEAVQMTGNELKTLLSIPSNSKSSVTISSLSGATITNTFAELAISGNIHVYSIQFDYASSGEIDPEFNINDAHTSKTFTQIPCTCVSYISSVYAAQTAYMTGSTPDKFKIRGSYQTATFRLTITFIQ